ncbi:chromosome partition protein Smc-like [Cydia amplana]|uniref:chromosome partition protein Smc-like n=1 Tax=Cydia amplana TaxID=1869771 RepID=UPI002FE53C32
MRTIRISAHNPVTWTPTLYGENKTFHIFSVTKQKMNTEREVGKLRITGSSISEELATIKSELEFFTRQLEESKSQISNARHQIAMIEICTSSETSKVSSHVEHLNAHREGYHVLFDKERALSEVREKELRVKEAEELESERQKLKIVAARNDQRAREAAVLDAESHAIEQACVVLKKRNNAIMLKLRRKLVETEDIRRELLKQKEQVNGNNNEQK